MRLLLVLLALSAGIVSADDGLAVKNAWIREAPPGASMMAGYLTIENTSQHDNALVAVSSPVFSHVMIHRSETVDGIARMHHLERLPLPAGGSVDLAPGGYHLMMPTPAAQPTAGERIPLTLHFADQSELQVMAPVKKKP